MKLILYAIFMMLAIQAKFDNFSDWVLILGASIIATFGLFNRGE